MKCYKTWIHTEWYLAVCTNALCAFLCYFAASDGTFCKCLLKQVDEK